ISKQDQEEESSTSVVAERRYILSLDPRDLLDMVDQDLDLLMLKSQPVDIEDEEFNPQFKVDQEVENSISPLRVDVRYMRRPLKECTLESPEVLEAMEI